MKIYVIHGEHSSQSYLKLQEYIEKAKVKDWKVVNLLTDSNLNIRETISSVDLFDKKRLFILNNLIKLNKKDIDWINQNKEESTGVLILYSKSEIKPTILNAFKEVDKVEDFKLPKNIFSFLDSFYPGNSSNCIKDLHQVLESEKPEFIFFLLSKHLRDLYWSKISPSNIPYSSWRVDKLERQSAKFPLNKLKEIINLFSDIDIKSKTTNSNIIDLLDLVILRKLE